MSWTGKRSIGALVRNRMDAPNESTRFEPLGVSHDYHSFTRDAPVSWAGVD